MMMKHLLDDPFAPHVSPLREKRRRAKRLRVTAILLAIVMAIVLFFGSVQPVRSDEEPPAPALPAPITAETPHELALHTQSDVFMATVTAYSSDEEQTDSSPEITASGSRVGPGTIACPSRYPFGTRILIAGKKYVCNDRMARKFRSGNYFDLWFPSRAAAIHFGRVRLQVKVLD